MKRLLLLVTLLISGFAMQAQSFSFKEECSFCSVDPELNAAYQHIALLNSQLSGQTSPAPRGSFLEIADKVGLTRSKFFLKAVSIADKLDNLTIPISGQVVYLSLPQAKLIIPL